MRTNRRLVLVPALVLAASISACGGGGNCVEGAYTHPETKICIKLPADFKVDEKARKTGDSSYLRASNSKAPGSFTIWLDKPDDLAKRAKSIENMATSDMKLVASGDTSQKGKFFHFHNAKGNYDFAQVLVSGKDHFYRCEIQNTRPEEAKPMIEACKTLGVPR